MRRGIDGLSALVETVVKEAPGSGAIFGFRGKRADRIKLLWWDGQGFCLFYKILERGYFPWPTTKDGVAHLMRASQKLDRISANSRTAVSLKSGQFDEVGPRQPGYPQG